MRLIFLSHPSSVWIIPGTYFHTLYQDPQHTGTDVSSPFWKSTCFPISLFSWCMDLVASLTCYLYLNVEREYTVIICSYQSKRRTLLNYQYFINTIPSQVLLNEVWYITYVCFTSVWIRATHPKKYTRLIFSTKAFFGRTCFICLLEIQGWKFC